MTTLTQRGLRLLGQLAGSPRLDALHLRHPSEKLLYQSTRLGFKAAMVTTRAFKAAKGLGGAPQRLGRAPAGDLFDLQPTDEQTMMVDAMRLFAAEQLRPSASAADAACSAPPGLLARAAELGVHALGIPESLGGVGTDASAVTQALIAEALAHGDMGLAWACLAPCAVSSALVSWGAPESQARYLPEFASDTPPPAALALQEPTPLFDPFELATRARRAEGGYVLQGRKSMVPLAGSAELFIVAAHLEGQGPALLVVESNAPGLSWQAEAPMGLRAAATGGLVLDHVTVPATALLAEGSAIAYADCVQRARLGWCALATGCVQAVLDHLVPYVNDRQAFGEPISHRQSVAFAVANIAIDLHSMRLLTWRAASLHDAGQPFHDAVALARRLCGDRAMQAGSDGVQLLGGHGFVKEHPVERWYRDLRAVVLMEGGLLL